MTEKIAVRSLTGVMETLLPVLYSRVFESRHESPLFHDPIAEQWVDRIDYDFSKYDDSYQNHLGVAIRTLILDEYVSDFLAYNPAAMVVNLAAGLDTRFYRMDNGQVRWIELDLPETIAIRRQLMNETDRHSTLAASALETAWMDDLAQDEPTLFIIEGLLMYLTEEQIRSMLGALAERFSQGEFLLEVLGVTQSRKTHLNDAISHTSAEFQFGIREASEMADWHPSLQYLGDTSIYDRHEDRWRALDIDFKGKPLSHYRNSTGRIVHLKVKQQGS